VKPNAFSENNPDQRCQGIILIQTRMSHSKAIDFNVGRDITWPDNKLTCNEIHTMATLKKYFAWIK
jgi:hypothetical protein